MATARFSSGRITGSEIAEIDILFAGGPAAQGIQFVEDNFHFGRRGPSLHLRFDVPQEKQAHYFYSEIEVPEGEDVIGSYLLARVIKLLKLQSV